jgi:hypothetical protein
MGVGVGTATLEPGGETVTCLNPADAGNCVVRTDVPAGTSATVTEQPGSMNGDPTNPPDSAFGHYGGACSGPGACTFTVNTASTVDVYFVPATVTLTLTADGDEDQAEMDANPVGGDAVAATDPRGPVYCGSLSNDDYHLPCTFLARTDSYLQVEADQAGEIGVELAGFSDNCVADGEGRNFCKVLMNANQTVTATFEEG